MLRQVRRAGWSEPRWTVLGRRRDFRVGDLQSARPVPERTLGELRALQATTAVAVLEADAGTYWWCRDRFWVESEGLEPDDVHALVVERDTRARRRLEHARAVAAQEGTRLARTPIPREVRLAVFERDGGRCVECGSDFELQFDHVIPVALGGAGTVENLQLLCAPCNRAKGAKLA